MCAQQTPTSSVGFTSPVDHRTVPPHVKPGSPAEMRPPRSRPSHATGNPAPSLKSDGNFDCWRRPPAGSHSQSGAAAAAPRGMWRAQPSLAAAKQFGAALAPQTGLRRRCCEAPPPYAGVRGSSSAARGPCTAAAPRPARSSVAVCSATRCQLACAPAPLRGKKQAIQGVCAPKDLADAMPSVPAWAGSTLAVSTQSAVLATQQQLQHLRAGHCSCNASGIKGSRKLTGAACAASAPAPCCPRRRRPPPRGCQRPSPGRAPCRRPAGPRKRWRQKARPPPAKRRPPPAPPAAPALRRAPTPTRPAATAGSWRPARWGEGRRCPGQSLAVCPSAHCDGVTRQRPDTRLQARVNVPLQYRIRLLVLTWLPSCRQRSDR